MRINWHTNLPPDVRAAIEPPLREFLWLAPTWLHMLTVCWDQDNQEHTCWTNTDPHYRIASLGVCPAFLSESAEARRSTVAHEMIHLPLAPLTEFTKDLIKRLCENDDFGKWVRDEWRQRFEGAVCDLEAAVMGRLDDST